MSRSELPTPSGTVIRSKPLPLEELQAVVEEHENRVDTIEGAYAAAVAAGYKIARGVHTQVAASDTVVTGLATVVAVVVSFQSAPTVKQLFCAGDIGDQAGSPAAGSILIKTYKPTAVNDVTPTAATDFSENLKIGWIAIGT